MFEYLVFDEHVGMAFHREARIEVDGDSLRYRIDGSDGDMTADDARAFLRRLEAFRVPSWNTEYVGGCSYTYSWGLRYKEVGRRCLRIFGFNTAPACYSDFVSLLFSLSVKGESVG